MIVIIKDKHFTFPIQEQDYPTVYLFYLFKINWTLFIFYVCVNIVSYITDKIDGYSIYGYVFRNNIWCYALFRYSITENSPICAWQGYLNLGVSWQLWLWSARLVIFNHMQAMKIIYLFPRDKHEYKTESQYLSLCCFEIQKI